MIKEGQDHCLLNTIRHVVVCWQEEQQYIYSFEQGTHPSFVSRWAIRVRTFVYHFPFLLLFLVYQNHFGRLVVVDPCTYTQHSMCVWTAPFFASSLVFLAMIYIRHPFYMPLPLQTGFDSSSSKVSTMMMMLYCFCCCRHHDSNRTKRARESVAQVYLLLLFALNKDTLICFTWSSRTRNTYTHSSPVCNIGTRLCACSLEFCLFHRLCRHLINSTL